MTQERAGHTLQATALVHEAFLRVGGVQGLRGRSKPEFYNAAAEAMRRILVEHARARARLKRGGGAARLDLDLAGVLDLAADVDPERILALDDAIRRLEGADPRAATVVRLRFLAGLSIEETAAAMDQSPRTVKRDWEFARAWLYQALDGQ
jgi:RNA polymerase sigma factor (TIGR02999 family)